MTLKYNISYEVASTIFLFILLFYIKLQYDTSAKINKEFRKLVWSCLIATILDIITAFTISNAAKVPVIFNTLLNTLYFLSVANLGYRVMFYVLYYVCRNKVNDSFVRVNQVLICIYALIHIANIFSGFFFEFTDNGEYIKGAIYLGIYAIPLYFVICSSIILIYNFKEFTLLQRTSISCFVSFQILGTVLQMFIFPDTLLALFVSSLGLLMMLFSMETPDYQRLIITIDELNTTKKVAEQAKEEAEKAKEIAQEASRLKSDFLANMSHEIRTPINAVLGMDEIILRESADSRIQECASDIKQAGSMLLFLINDILDFSKIESGKMDIVPVEYDLGILLSDTMDMVRSRAKEKNLKLKLNVEPDTPAHLFGDEIRIRQIITNILTNAVKYTAVGQVELSVSGKKISEEMVQLYVSVKDTGIGIKEEDKERLFDSFQRVDECRNRNIEGTGLGLAITMRLLNLMGSCLEVESTYGEGSRFYFCLEQKTLDEVTIGPDIWEYCKNEKKRTGVAAEKFYAPEARILVVDDNAMNLKVFLGLLNNHGMKIDTAMSGRECLKLVQENAYHIIFMDHLMPEMDGVETLGELKRLEANQSKDAIIIILTANAVSGAREMFLKEGFDDFLSKPIDVIKLERMIKGYLPKEILRDFEQEQERPPEDSTNDSDEQSENGLVDWKKGRTFCMDDENFFREILEIFLETPYETELTQYLNEENFKSYATLVHGLKTNLTNIGAAGVSDMAKQLERAIKTDNDESFVKDNHEEFIAAYRNVVAEVEAYLKK